MNTLALEWKDVPEAQRWGIFASKTLHATLEDGLLLRGSAGRADADLKGGEESEEVRTDIR